MYNHIVTKRISARQSGMFTAVMFRHNRIAYYCFYITFRMKFFYTRRATHAVASRSRQSEMELVADYSRIGAYRTCTSGKDFPCEHCAQNSGDVSPIK